MGELRKAVPMLLVVAAFSRHTEALDWAVDRLEAHFGPVGLRCPDFRFEQTTYYQATMGPELLKRLLVFRDLVPADCLPRVKHCTNDFEKTLADETRFSEVRPLNLDPGLLMLGKFLLATTKDQSHRIYLTDGIFAEVTLRYRDGAYEPWPWTYADYRLPTVLEFLNTARDYYKSRLRAEGGNEAPS